MEDVIKKLKETVDELLNERLTYKCRNQFIAYDTATYKIDVLSKAIHVLKIENNL